jgi:hypothetical protein
LPQGYYFPLDAFSPMRIQVDLGFIQHDYDAREPANGEGRIFEIGSKFLVAIRRLRMKPKPFREGQKLTGQHFGRNLMHGRALACGFCQGSFIAALRPRLRGAFHRTGISLWMGRHGRDDMLAPFRPSIGSTSFPGISMLIS